MLPILPATAFLSEYMWKIRSGKSSRREGEGGKDRDGESRDWECVCVCVCFCEKEIGKFSEQWTFHSLIHAHTQTHIHTHNSTPDISSATKGRWRVSLNTHTRERKIGKFQFSNYWESRSTWWNRKLFSAHWRYAHIHILFTFHPSLELFADFNNRFRLWRRPPDKILRACAFHGQRRERKRKEGRVFRSERANEKEAVRGEWVSTKYIHPYLIH